MDCEGEGRKKQGGSICQSENISTPPSEDIFSASRDMPKFTPHTPFVALFSPFNFNYRVISRLFPFNLTFSSFSHFPPNNIGPSPPSMKGEGEHFSI